MLSLAIPLYIYMKKIFKFLFEKKKHIEKLQFFPKFFPKKSQINYFKILINCFVHVEIEPRL
jgi:hypothetical protein